MTSFNRSMCAGLLLLALVLTCAFCGSNAYASDYPTPKLTGVFTVGGVAGASFGSPDRPSSTVMHLELKLNNAVGPVSLFGSYRQPLFGNSFWNDHVEQFRAGLSFPVGKTTFFGTYERNPHTGFDWFETGVSIPF